MRFAWPISRGLFDGMQQAKIVEETKNSFCPPPSPDLDQMKLIIEQWVQNNPKNTSVSIGKGCAACSVSRVSM